MSGAVVAIMLADRGYFTPVVHDYTFGSGTETIPTGANQVVIQATGAGGGGGDTSSGSFGDGGGGGGYATRTIVLTPVDWGKTLAYVVGSTTVTNTTFGTAVAIAANPGGGGSGGSTGSPGGGGTGGTASGGTTNVTGDFGVAGSLGGTGGFSGDPDSYGYGGNGAQFVGPGDPGGSGRVRFAYT